MKKTRISFRLLAMVLLVLMASCTHTKKTAKPAVESKVNPSASLVEHVLAHQPSFTSAMASKTRVTLEYQQRKVSANATIAILADSAMVVSVQPFMGVELVRAELTHTQIVIIDKLNRRYSSVTFEQLSRSAGYKLTYADIEALLTNRLFAVEHDRQWLKTARLEVQKAAQTSTLTFAQRQLQQSFVVNNANSRIEESKLALLNNEVRVSYHDLSTFNTTLFPATIEVELAAEQLSAKCTINLQTLAFDVPVNVTPAALGKYTKVGLSTIVPM